MGRVTVLLITLLFLEIGLSSSQYGGWGPSGIIDINERQAAPPQWKIHKIIRHSVEVAVDHGLARPPSDIAASPGVVKKIKQIH